MQMTVSGCLPVKVRSDIFIYLVGTFEVWGPVDLRGIKYWCSREKAAWRGPGVDIGSMPYIPR